MLSVRHSAYVARVCTDEAGKVYSAGGDGVVYCFALEGLLDAVEQRMRERVVERRVVSCLGVGGLLGAGEQGRGGRGVGGGGVEGGLRRESVFEVELTGEEYRVLYQGKERWISCF